jgi:hypothetical protein
MSKAWIKAKHAEFARDVLRDFCLASNELERRFQEYDLTGLVDFEGLRDLTGQEMDKGLLWRLKDTSHHLFRHDPDDMLIGKFLDWALGYIFHETLKLKEDAYQQQNYAPWFKELQRRDMPEHEQRFCHELMQVLFQTRESIEREVKRIRFILSQCQGMFPVYYHRHRNNALLARFLFNQNELVRGVFQERYETLIQGVYGDAPEHMHLLAAQSLRQGGWMRDANKAVDEALRTKPGYKQAQHEKKVLERLLADSPPSPATPHLA